VPGHEHPTAVAAAAIRHNTISIATEAALVEVVFMEFVGCLIALLCLKFSSRWSEASFIHTWLQEPVGKTQSLAKRFRVQPLGFQIAD
jgi:hypothetical protein